MKKWIFIGSGAVVVIVIVLLVVGLSNLGPIIKNAVNTYAPGMTKTDVRLEDVSVSIFTAEAKLKDFYLGNPTGFKSPQAMRVGSIYMDVDESSLTGDTVIIEKIEVVAPQITYEKKRGTDNFMAILNNVKKAVGAEKSSGKQSGEQGPGKKILIRNFIVRDGKVNLALTMLGGKGISAPLPDIHLKDVGKEKAGASPAEAFKEIFAALYAQITSSAVSDALNNQLKALGSSMKSVVEGATKQLGPVSEGAKKGVESVGDKVKGLFDK